ncbi:hypothetical protein [Bacteroides timonensis]|uniref:hypothetical protein n=1 Tax=Bacteroides timonensis TaxID=1470345 RepID=UPI0004B5B12A|nr:hypothetical protein [Bacteroides timonensis]
MKRFLLIPFMLLAMVSLAACGGSDDNLLPPEEPEVPVEPTPGEDPEQPAPGGGSNGIETLSVAGDMAVKFEKP